MAERPPARPIAVSTAEAARLVGVGRTMFYEAILPELDVVRVGSRVLVPIVELERWLAEHAGRP